MKDLKTGHMPLSRRRFFQSAGAACLGLSCYRSFAQLAASSTVVDAFQPPAPAWINELILYEIATKSFTSPRGPETGDFRSTEGRLEYLHELGITGIWLSGYSLCDPHHFYNVWTQYAVLRPDLIDPTLGTEEDFAHLVDKAHENGIRVFLDVITHGLMKSSPIVKEHASWFRGGSWGMSDFDWQGGHTDLDAWWVGLVTNYVIKYHVDGFRLDLGIYRPDLWERIRQNASAAGHPIVVFAEFDAAVRGVTDFMQRENALGVNHLLPNDLPGFYDRNFGRKGHFDITVQFEDDGSTLNGSTSGAGPLNVEVIGLSRNENADVITDNLPAVELRVSNLPNRHLEQVTLSNDMGQNWQLRKTIQFANALILGEPQSASPDTKTITQPIYIPTISHGSAVELSCHDDGWEGFPSDKNPYIAQGSRSLFGYSFLFSPMVPIFFSGEEFNATYRPLPLLTPKLYGGANPGKGRWLYGAMLDWSELNRLEHRAMFDDVKALIAIRKSHPAIFSLCVGDNYPNLRKLSYRGDVEVPVPYVRWHGNDAIIVTSNRLDDQDAHLTLSVPLAEIGMPVSGSFRLLPLWPPMPAEIRTASELDSLTVTIKRDKVAQGGLAIFKLTAIGKSGAGNER